VLSQFTKPNRPKRYLLIAGGLIVAGGITGALIFLSLHAGSSEKDNSGVSMQPRLVAPRPAPQTVITPTVPPDYTLPLIKNGLAPVITTLSTKENIVFLGIDDGAFKDQSVVAMMQQNHIKASLFLSKLFIASNPDFFKQLVAQGSVVEDHTLSHNTKMTTTQTYIQQKAEICGMADYDMQHYGLRPTLFRPPGGAYSDTMRRAAADCGMKAVANGGAMQYQVGKKLRPGDIVLMHFRPEFKKDMQAFVDAETAAGLHTELLENAL
jgi:peptidoglycan/xylan/chitin deacetylase (PgdA/CDA1 family)